MKKKAFVMLRGKSPSSDHKEFNGTHKVNQGDRDDAREITAY